MGGDERKIEIGDIKKMREDDLEDLESGKILIMNDDEEDGVREEGFKWSMEKKFGRGIEREGWIVKEDDRRFV